MIEDIKLADYITSYGENWADVMPANCPPIEVSISHGDTFYRFTEKEDVISPNDWLNQLMLHPKNTFTNAVKILAAGLSMCNDLNDAKRQLNLPYIKKKFKGLAQISLDPEDGVIKQTSDNQHHYTWWRTKTCNLNKAQMV